MSKIQILSEHLANQIAAGEVIERPASVLKEFLENSLDAGGRHITVQVEGGGTRLIRVIDDGEGMDNDDVLLCLERHATSKLHEKGDDQPRLSEIRTLGFRGEAIPSIASVSRLTITSRARNSSMGTRAEIRYGQLVKVHETGAAQGTVMEMRNLFGNMPARKKFLKSLRTELAHLEEVIKNYSLANPDVAITYQCDDKTIIDLPAGDSLANRLRKFIGRGTLATLIQITPPLFEKELSAERPKLSGYLLAPDETQPASARLRLFVNGRAVRNRLLAHAVSVGLSNFLMKGRQPAGAFFVELAPAEVDVNVHPTKQEIRFRHANRIHRAVEETIRHTMLLHQQATRDELFGGPEGERPRTPPRPADQPAGQNPPPPARPYRQNNLPLAGPGPAFTAGEEKHEVTFESWPSRSAGSQEGRDSEPLILEKPEEQRLIPLGQLLDLYLLCQGPDGLVVIDQHAVHERLIFENLKKQLAERGVASQNLLFTQLVELDDGQFQTLKDNFAEIEALGLRLEEFGGSAYLIKAVPAIMNHLAPEEILLDVLKQFAGPDPDNNHSPTRLDAVLADMACKASIKAGHKLEPEEMEALLNQMRSGQTFTHCPHGRPTIKRFTVAEIKNWFHRG